MEKAARESLEYSLEVELGELKESLINAQPVKNRRPANGERRINGGQSMENASPLETVETWVYPLRRYVRVVDSCYCSRSGMRSP